MAYGYDAITFAFVPAVSSTLPNTGPFFCSCTLIALSIGWRLTVSNTRAALPLTNENPAVPLPFEDALYDAAANPDAAHGRGLDW